MAFFGISVVCSLGWHSNSQFAARKAAAAAVLEMIKMCMLYIGASTHLCVKKHYITGLRSPYVKK